MKTHRYHPPAGFTLVEIMIVVAIIGLLAALAIPGLVKARKQSQGRRIMNDARQIDAAIDQWALEYHKVDGAPVDLTAIVEYLKHAATTNLTLNAASSIKYASVFPLAFMVIQQPQAIPSITDSLGNPFIIGAVGDHQVMVHPATMEALDGVGIDWGPYAYTNVYQEQFQ
jgi:prepilin-type N-terminal cleavage/methylation domain-containing protein